ncbi:MAG: organomercurial lyase [Acidimicrobiales bacterium]
MSSVIEDTSHAFITGSGFLRAPEDQRVARAIYELLATGQPAPPDEIAERAGVAVADVEGRLGSWPAIFRDAGGGVTGFWGLASDQVSNHRFDVEGVGTSWTWCAYDPLFIARILGATAHVTSQCPVTDITVRLTVTPEGVRDIEPATATLSMLSPDRASFDDVITTLCHYILFFATPEAALSWTSEQPGTFVVSIDDGFEIARRMTDSVFGAVLATPRGGR